MKRYHNRIVLICFFFISACSSDKKTELVQFEDDTKKEVLVLDKNLERTKVYHNTLIARDKGLEVEVLYVIDEATKVYREWVMYSVEDTTSYSTFSLPYSEFMPSDYEASKYESYMETRKADEFKAAAEFVTNEFMQRLTSDNLNKEAFSRQKKLFEDSSKYEVINKDYDTCDEKIVGVYLNLKRKIQEEFQTCRSSEHYAEALIEAGKFYNQNRFISYRDLFGLMRVVPRMHTYFEFDKFTGRALGVGTVITPGKALSNELAPGYRYVKACHATPIFNPTHDFMKHQAVFIGSANKPLAPDYKYFVDMCRQYRRSHRADMEILIQREFPDASLVFKKELEIYASTLDGHVPFIDEFISNLIDAEINKSNVYKKNNESTMDSRVRIFSINDEPFYQRSFSTGLGSLEAYDVLKLSVLRFLDKTHDNFKVEVDYLDELEMYLKRDFKEIK